MGFNSAFKGLSIPIEVIIPPMLHIRLALLLSLVLQSA